jgi:hypothetical protein
MTRRLAQSLALAVAVLALTSCTRTSSVARLSLVPTLELGALANRQSAHGRASARARWDIVASAWLRWRLPSQVPEVPLRFELEPESALSPCASGDEVCLVEAAEVERELADVLRELP